MHDRIIELAERAHAAHWRMSGDEGTGDRLDSKDTFSVS
jgi:hypothetical protein